MKNSEVKSKTKLEKSCVQSIPTVLQRPEVN